VYVDPAWRLSRPADGFDPASFVEFADHATYEAIAAWAPRWETDDIEIELATLAVWDRRTALESSRYAVAALDAGTAGDGTGLPSRAEVPSLITLAEQSRMTDTQDAETLRRRGFELRTVPGAGHSIHRDDLEGFMTALEASL
jgi:pimeloyl-ACP methyl ester carboxylesterase